MELSRVHGGDALLTITRILKLPMKNLQSHSGHTLRPFGLSRSIIPQSYKSGDNLGSRSVYYVHGADALLNYASEYP